MSEVMVRKLWVARHGNRYDFIHPEWFLHAARPADPPLSQAGHLQAQELAARLSREPIDCLFCSPYLRAVQTAVPLALARRLPLRLEAGLGEWLNPEWLQSPPQLMALVDLQRHYPCIDASYAAVLQPQYPEPQAASTRARIGQTLQQLLSEHPGNIVCIGHAIGMEAAVEVLGVDSKTLDTSPCSLLEFHNRSGNWHLEIPGDTTHLSAPGTIVWQGESL